MYESLQSKGSGWRGSSAAASLVSLVDATIDYYIERAVLPWYLFFKCNGNHLLSLSVGVMQDGCRLFWLGQVCRTSWGVSRCGVPVVLPCSAQNEKFYTSVQNGFQLAGIVKSSTLAFNKEKGQWRLCGLLEAVRLGSWWDACRFPGSQDWLLDLPRGQKGPIP